MNITKQTFALAALLHPFDADMEFIQHPIDKTVWAVKMGVPLFHIEEGLNEAELLLIIRGFGEESLSAYHRRLKRIIAKDTEGHAPDYLIHRATLPQIRRAILQAKGLWIHE